jgi:signal transduction histidine kinase
MDLSNLFGRINSEGQLVDQMVGHKGLLEINVHIAAGFFLFLAALLAIVVVWLNFGRRGHGWFALRLGILFIGFIGLGEAAEHFFSGRMYAFFHYLHIVAAPLSLFFLYLAIDELQLLYFNLKQKPRISNQSLYLISFAAVATAGLLGYQTEAGWDRVIEVPILTLSLVPTMIIVYLLFKRTLELYRVQHRVPIFNLAVFSTALGMIPLLAWSTVGLTLTIWLGRVGDLTDQAAPYVIFHVLQDMFHAGVGATLLGGSLIFMLSSDTKSIEYRLAQSAKLISIGEMAATVAEDLNNPLLNIIGYSSLMISDPAIPAGRREDLELIRREASKAANITEGLLDFAGKTGPKFRIIDVEASIDQALNLMDGRARQIGVKIVKEVQKPLPYISADPDQLKQAFVNIMNNAMDAMPRGGRLTVSAAGAGEQVEIRFADTGDGIPPDALPDIFRPFFSSKGAGATGLGLSLSQNIIQQHLGTVEVSSQVGLGTTFVIMLPALTGQEASWYDEFVNKPV